jgi:hypothetical protein
MGTTLTMAFHLDAQLCVVMWVTAARICMEMESSIS